MVMSSKYRVTNEPDSYDGMGKAQLAAIEDFLKKQKDEEVSTFIRHQGEVIQQQNNTIIQQNETIEKYDNRLGFVADERSEYVAMTEGFKAVIRQLMNSLRLINPNHPMLKKENRDKLFKEYEKAAMDKINQERKNKGIDPVVPRLGQDSRNSF